MRLLGIAILAAMVALFYYLPGHSANEKIAWLQQTSAEIQRIWRDDGRTQAKAIPKGAATPVAKTKPDSGGVTNPDKLVIHARDSKALNMEQAIFKAINEERKRRGLKPFVWDEKVAELARLKSIENFEIGKLTHQSPKYGWAVEMYEKFGIKFRKGSEVAAGRSVGDADPVEVALSWFESPSHCAVLTDNYERAGVGVAWTDKNVILHEDRSVSDDPTGWVFNVLVYTPK